MENLKELKEIRFNETDVILNNNLVRGSILPERMAELKRNIIFTGNTVVEGPIFGNRIEVRAGAVEIKGAVFAQKELYISPDENCDIKFEKAVGSASSVAGRCDKCRPTFCSDINAKSVALRNAFVAGSIYADEIKLDNCIVIGGVFATQDLELTNTMVGTFNSPSVRLDGKVYMLLPSAFSVEPAVVAPDTCIYNLSLADLGDLYRGLPQAPDSGYITVDPASDEVKSNLANEETQRVLRSYTVVGKVLAADLIDTDKFQNHFLLTAASLGPQLLKTYDLGRDADDGVADLSIERIRDFFFDILQGRKEVQPLSSTFSLTSIISQAR